MADYPIRTREQAFLAAIAGEGEMPTPKNRKEAILAKAGGADVDIEPKSGNEYWTLAAMQGGGGSSGGVKTVVIAPEQTVTPVYNEQARMNLAVLSVDRTPEPTSVSVTINGTTTEFSFTIQNHMNVFADSAGHMLTKFDALGGWVITSDNLDAMTIKIEQSVYEAPGEGYPATVNIHNANLLIREVDSNGKIRWVEHEGNPFTQSIQVKLACTEDGSTLAADYGKIYDIFSAVSTGTGSIWSVSSNSENVTITKETNDFVISGTPADGEELVFNISWELS